jgi:acetyl-CoA carboxylase biotin carboxylase subunit
MFKKILIANRGEIAVRIIGTCKRLGIRTVAVFSGADSESLHVRMADEVYCIGDPSPAKSYLLQDKIIETALAAKAEAIHPGYGFLSENPDFSSKVAESGIKFIGPSAEAIRIMGDKVNARRLAARCRIPVLPGSGITIKSGDDARRIAMKIRYPVLIKASAGGGGKGMRIAKNEDELLNAVTSAKTESQSAFGRGDIFLEKYIERAKHIEIQIMADEHGSCVHFGERECSVQRRHQKIIEETPSVVVTPKLRRKMGAAAVKLALHAGYSNAGTVEFIVDEDGNFYFLEVNTRLQVEHPITELCNDVDLVEQQLDVAAGGRLKMRQKKIASVGAAIECRICAEDPLNDHHPSPGTVKLLRLPSMQNVRVDTFLYEGCEVTSHYDSLLAKVIAYGQNRSEAIHTMKQALDGTIIYGVKTNIALCKFVLQRDEFLSGEYHTDLLQKIPLAEIHDGSYEIDTSGLVGSHIYDNTY